MNVGKTMPLSIPKITIFIGGMLTIPSHGWFMALFFPTLHQITKPYPLVNQHSYGKSPCLIGK